MTNLHWHTDLEDAKQSAKTAGMPIVSLRLLGRLDETLSCANSRFFKKTLYPNARVAKLLGERAVLHWRSVRPVPRITIDFGDGRKIERTITGNSAHLVLDAAGCPVDAIPGLYGPSAFVEALGRSLEVARSSSSLRPRERESTLRRHHLAALAELDRRFRMQGAPSSDREWSELAALAAIDVGLDDETRSKVARAFPTAIEAGARAMTKMRVEAPMLSALAKLERSIAEDTLRNEFELHRRIHERFIDDPPKDDVAFTDWIYAELFSMPKNDPWLGLVPDDAYAAVEQI